MDKRVGYAVGWLLAVLVAVAVGIATVTAVGATMTGRGPLGDKVIRDVELSESPTPSDPQSTAPVTEPVPGQQDELVTRVIEDEFGAFVVGCRGVYAVGLEVRPDEAAGWRVVSYERGPDDDVDAVFSQGGRSAEVEVFCNRGVPTVAEIEYDELPDD